MRTRVDLAEAANTRRKLRDCAFLLPIAGAVLLTPPFIRIFATSGVVFGVPVIAFYLSVIWLGLILTSRMLSNALMRTHEISEDRD